MVLLLICVSNDAIFTDRMGPTMIKLLRISIPALAVAIATWAIGSTVVTAIRHDDTASGHGYTPPCAVGSFLALTTGCRPQAR